MPNGTIIDFLQLAAQTPALARDLGELAAKYHFEFTSDELSDAQLDAVAGGTDSVNTATMADSSESSVFDLQQSQQQLTQMTSTLSNILKLYHDTHKAIISNLK